MRFTHNNIVENYENIEKIEKHGDIKYVFSNDRGSNYLELHVLRQEGNENEIRIIIDNFPFPRKFYSTNIPFRNIEDFEAMFARMNVKLPPRKASEENKAKAETYQIETE